MPALRRGLRMGRNLHYAVRTEGGVPEFDRLLEPRERRRLTESRALADVKPSELAESPAPCFSGAARALIVTMFACGAALILPILAVPDEILAADSSTLSDEKALSGENSE